VLEGRENVRAPEQVLVGLRVVDLDAVEDVLEANHAGKINAGNPYLLPDFFFAGGGAGAAGRGAGTAWSFRPARRFFQITTIAEAT
jgi:hypothetical protein